jgi:hypothetical protein
LADRGYIKLYRSLFRHEFFRPAPFSDREAFLWMLAEASWRERRQRVGHALINVGRGQLVSSFRMLAATWGWSTGAIGRYLKRCEEQGLIAVQTDVGLTTITVCNYELYSDVGEPESDPDIPFFSRWEIADSVRPIKDPPRRGSYIPVAVRRAVLARDGRVCRYCTSVVGPFHFDHQKPWSRGGKSTIENIVVACEACNLSKGARTPEEWRSAS